MTEHFLVQVPCSTCFNNSWWRIFSTTFLGLFVSTITKIMSSGIVGAFWNLTGYATSESSL